MAKGKLTYEAARERGDDRSRGSWQDDADGGDHDGAVEEVGGEAKAYDQIDAAPEERRAGSRSTRRTWSTRRRTVTMRTWTVLGTRTTSRT